jgi:hypothetical protein
MELTYDKFVHFEHHYILHIITFCTSSFYLCFMIKTPLLTFAPSQIICVVKFIETNNEIIQTLHI